MIGQTLGHYTILELLGAGGMGEVYRAEDMTLRRQVALKILPPVLAASQERLERFQREAETLAALDHPNIVTIYSVESAAVGGPIPGAREIVGEGLAPSRAGTSPAPTTTVRFLTMQLVEGKQLSELIPKGGLPLERIFDIAIPLADALAAAHEKGVIHRDLKPANVMVTTEDRVKVLDFGLAKLRPEREAEESTQPETETLTREGRILGTVPYMSPDQVQGKAADRRSDIFSLGAMLYEMATGVRPFQGETPSDLISSILRDTPRSVDEVKTDLPHHLARIIRHCLEKNPEQRYQSAKDVRNELESLTKELESEELLARAGPAAAPRPQKKRLVWRATLAAAALIAIAAGVTWLTSGRLGERPVPTPAPPEIQSLAVLPFDNLMEDPEQDYFVEGMHEALITDLSKLTALRVISRTTMMRYRGTDKSIPEIARELGVDVLIEGSVLRADNQVRVTAQLISGATDENLWADSYDRDLENVLVLLSEVARAIAGEIEVRVTPEQEQRLASVALVDPAAHEAFLRGLYFVNRGSLNGVRQAQEHLERAVRIDPTFADGWSALANEYGVLAFLGLEPREEMIPKARQAAARALELDQTQAGAHAALGWVALYFDWDWEGAARHLERALALDPDNTQTRHAYADYLGVMGDCEGSIEQVMTGRQYDPMGAWGNIFVVGHLAFCGRYEAAVAEGGKAAEFLPDHPSLREFTAHALWRLGRYDEALAEYRQAWAADSAAFKQLEQGFAAGGPRGAMLARARHFEELAESRAVDPLAVAVYYAEAGEVDATFDWLEQAFGERTPQLPHIAIDAYFEPMIRDDPRFNELLRRIGIPGAER